MSESAAGDSQFLSHIGTSSFFPAFLNHVRHASPGLPVDPVIVQSILLCLIAGNKHLIIRAAEEDIGLVVKLAVKTLATIFGLLTHRLRIHRRHGSFSHLDPSSSMNAPTFLRSLFIPSGGASFNPPNHLDETSTLTGYGHRVKYRNKRAKSRSSSRTATVRSKVSHYTKSSSYHNDMMPAKLTTGMTLPVPSASDKSGESQNSSALSNGIGTMSSNAFSSASRTSSLSGMPPFLPHSHSDPTPVRIKREASNIQLPNAIVISGIENASLASQRALTTVLTERRVILEPEDPSTWDTGSTVHRHSRSTFDGQDVDNDLNGIWTLPDNFILVYVCPTNEWERPAIHKSLLDRFAMSVTVAIHPTLRSLANTFFHPLSYRSSPILSPMPQLANYTPNSTPPFFTQPLPNRQLSPGVMTPSNGSHAIISSEILSSLQETYSKTYFSSALNFYISDLFSAARHHPQLDGTLLTAAAMSHAFDLIRAARILGGDPTGMELIQDLLLHDLGKVCSDSAISGSTESIMNVIESGSVTMGAVLDEMHEHAGPSEGLTLPVLDVTQADVARIVPRVISHRLRVFGGPEDEVLASALYGATFFTENERGRIAKDRRITVKDILVRILQEV